MPSARHSRLWLLGVAAGLGFILGTRSDIAPAVRADRPPPRSRRRWPVVAVLACALLAGASVVGWRSMQSAREEAIARSLTGGDPERAAALVTRYGCAGCHTIPGLQGADGQVAPPLGGLRQRVFVGGVVRNTPDNLIAWIVDPRAMSPHTAMPVTGISPQEARDVATYLYAH